MNITYLQRNEIPAKHLLKRFLRRVKNSFYFHDQDGFFESALQSLSGTKDTSTFTRLGKNESLLIEHTDAVVVNLKCQYFRSIHEQKKFFQEFLKQHKDVVKCLFINAAQASYMFDDTVLDNFDIVFKREPYRDRNKYALSEKNKAKIAPTMIHCPFSYAPRDNIFAKTLHTFRPKVKPCHSEEQKYEVGFSGVDAASHSLRRDAWERVINEGFITIGGLQSNPHAKMPVPEKLQGPRLKGKAYRDALCQAKINLALDGIGEYTFRHQELLYLGAFMMSGPSIRTIELPMPLEENKHYVAFDDLDDMVEKIRYYLAHDTERQKIAAAGKALFEEYYDPVRHGLNIVNAIQTVQKDPSQAN